MNTATFANKPVNVNDIPKANTDPVPYVVTDTWKIGTVEYGQLIMNLTASRQDFEGKGGSAPLTGAEKVIRISARNRRTLLVNPEGYSYARRVAYETV